MNDLERTFRDGLRQAVADRPGGVRVDIDEVIARASAPDFVPETRWTPPRWLAAAAAVLVVAGLGVSLAVFRPSAGIPAAPAAPSPSAATQFDASGLVGSRWWAVQIDGRSVSAANEATQPYLRFTSTSELTFFDGCNTGIARYRLEVGLRPEFSATLGPVGAVACREDQGRFVDALSAAWSMRKSGELLEFLDPSDNVVLKLARADGAEPQPTEPPTSGVVVAVDSPSAPVTPSPTATATEPPTASSSPTAGVHVRIYNDTGVTLHKVKVGFPGGVVIGVDTMAPGTYSAYLGVDVAYQLASLEATADGHPYKLTPSDYVGEKPLDPGNYTYRIRLTEGVMFLEFGD